MKVDMSTIRPDTDRFPLSRREIDGIAGQVLLDIRDAVANQQLMSPEYSQSLLALWILEQDILSEDVLTDRKSWTDIGMACRGIDDDLHDAFLETTSRFSDGHYWRDWDYMSANWQRFGTTSSFGIGTLIHFADESTDKQWRYTCPFWGSKTQKQFISPCYQLLRSHKPGTPGFYNFPITGYE